MEAAELYIGVDENARVEHGRKYRAVEPVLAENDRSRDNYGQIIRKADRIDRLVTRERNRNGNGDYVRIK